MIECSICLATKDKAIYLDRTLESIRRQIVPFEYEIVVVDDGSTDNTKEICDKWRVDKYVFLENPIYRNPSVARNTAYRLAVGKSIICQSDDTLHESRDAVEILCNRLHQNEFVIATVYNWNIAKQERKMLYTGVKWIRPLFFLGSLWRKDLYAVGGNDEEFMAPGYEDNWFGDCLIKGLKLRATFRSEVIGYHQDHLRPANLAELVRPSRVLYEKKVRLAQEGKIPWQASGGPWQYEE